MAKRWKHPAKAEGAQSHVAILLQRPALRRIARLRIRRENDSIASSDSVTSTGVPKTVVVLRNDRSHKRRAEASGTITVPASGTSSWSGAG